MVTRVKLLKAWNGFKAGTVTEVGKSVADQLVADGFAEVVAEKRGAKPTRTKVTRAAAVKG